MSQGSEHKSRSVRARQEGGQSTLKEQRNKVWLKVRCLGRGKA